LIDINNSWFQSSSPGILGNLIRRFQPDLGLFLYEGKLVCTSHTALLNTGLTEQSLTSFSLSLDNLGPHLLRISIDLGSYMGMLFTEFGIPPHQPKESISTATNCITLRDVRSDHFYRAMPFKTPATDPTMCILITGIISSINTALYIVPFLAHDHVISAFKIKFITLFHASSSIQIIINRDRISPFLTEEAKQILGELLGNSSIRNLRKMKKFRNLLMHYGVDREKLEVLSEAKPFYGIVESYLPGISFSNLADQIDSGLETFSQGLTKLIKL
jgi:uncharacterized protein YutE (UPF0331/DUF86 family)